MKRIYLAGSYNAGNVVDVLDNMRRGMRMATKILLTGDCVPFVPWFDYHFQLMLREGEQLTIQNYRDYSMAWLEVSDEIWVMPGSEDSGGTQAEINRARELGIPVKFL